MHTNLIIGMVYGYNNCLNCVIGIHFKIIYLAWKYLLGCIALKVCNIHIIC